MGEVARRPAPSECGMRNAECGEAKSEVGSRKSSGGPALQITVM